MDWADKIMSASSDNSATKNISWSDRLIEPQLYEEKQPTGEVSTITGEPKTEWVPDTSKTADWNTIQKSGWVDKPESKIQIFAASRFPDLPKAEREAKYKIFDGTVAYLGDDGKYHKEVGGGDLLSSLKTLSASSISRLPELVLSTGGAIGGSGLGAGLGAAGGAGIRKTVGNLAFGEDQTTGENVKDMATAFALAFAGEKAGELLGAGTQAVKTKSALGGNNALKYSGAAQDLAMSGFTAEEHAQAAFIKEIADQYGIDLLPHQLYNRKGMQNIWKYLRQHPQTSDAVQKFETNLSDQVDSAIKTFSGSVGGSAGDTAEVGVAAANTAKGMIDSAKSERTNAVTSLYNKAFEGAPEVSNISATALNDSVSSTLEGTVKGGETYKAFNKIQTMLESAGTNSKKLQSVKKEIDKMIPYLNSETQREVSIFKAEINDVLSQEVPGYSSANQLYAAMSTPIERTEKGLIGRLSRMETDQAKSRAVNEIFSNNTTPELVSQTKTYYQTADPELWNDIIATHIKTTYDNLSATESGELINVPGKMYKQLFGSASKREKMKAAMGDNLYKNFEGFMSVMQAASRGTGKESMTMPFSRIDESLGAIPGSKIYRYAMFPRQAVTESVFSKWNDMIVRGRQEDLFNALTSKYATEKISKLKALKPGTKAFIREVGLFNAWMSKAVYESDLYKAQELSPAHQTTTPQGQTQ